MELRVRDAAYIYVLSQIKSVKAHNLLQIVEAFPEPDALINASTEELGQKLNLESLELLSFVLQNQWSNVWKLAQETISRQLDKGLELVLITDEVYSPLLKLIPDPPPILYAKGNTSILCKSDAVAIVGTRNPTAMGKKVADRIAKYFSQANYVIVSGLAKGIDTAAHQGALDANGLTIAVMGTSLDRIYPAKNKPLAERIVKNSGALVSEIPIGKHSFKAGFIQRDRIQSGLVLGVIPVQTDLTGGTMHTVKFAEEYSRLLFCPKPIDAEKHKRQYKGILHLIHAKRGLEFQGEDYPELLKSLQENKQRLLSLRTEPDSIVNKAGNKSAQLQLELKGKDKGISGDRD